MRKHLCNWPGCPQKVPLARWGCSKHWMKLPQRIRIAIWGSYCPGQEVSHLPSIFYQRAAQAAQDYILFLEGKRVSYNPKMAKKKESHRFDGGDVEDVRRARR